MFSQIDQIADPFGTQFKPDGMGFIYRMSRRGAAFRVSAEERDRFVADFRRWHRRSIAGMTAGFLAAVVLSFFVATQFDESYALPLLAGWSVAVMGIYALLLHRAWRAPVRALSRRTPEGAPLTRSEIREMTLNSVSYGMLAMAAFTGVVIVGINAFKYDVWHGWGRLWWSPAIVLGGLSAIQALRKWRFEREG